MTSQIVFVMTNPQKTNAWGASMASSSIIHNACRRVLLMRLCTVKARQSTNVWDALCIVWPASDRMIINARRVIYPITTCCSVLTCKSTLSRAGIANWSLISRQHWQIWMWRIRIYNRSCNQRICSFRSTIKEGWISRLTWGWTASPKRTLAMLPY